MIEHTEDLTNFVNGDTDIRELVTYLDSHDRCDPVVIVSPGKRTSGYGVCTRTLAAALADHAEVHVLSSLATTWKLGNYPQYRTYGGAVRVVGPPGWSIVIRTDHPDDDVLTRITDAVADAEGRLAASGTTIDLHQPLRPCTVSPADVAARHRAHSAGTASEPSREPDGDDELRSMREELDQAREREDALLAELQTMRVSRDMAAAEANTALARIQSRVNELETHRQHRMRAEQQVRELSRQLATAQQTITALKEHQSRESAPLFSDPQTQFRDDVTRAWLVAVDEPERNTYPLREFRVGPAFLTSLDLPQAPRRKVIDVVVEVLCRRAYENPARNVRPHGDGGPAAATGQLIRTDGAAAYRCNIRTNTPQAPRLLWWELTDGTVELALAGRHDDPMP